MKYRLLQILIFLIISNSLAFSQGDFFNLVIPNSPTEVDLQVWKPYKSPDVPAGKGHTNEWISKDGYRLAFDADGDNSHWHVYNKESKRLQSNGKLAGYEKNGTFIYESSLKTIFLMIQRKKKNINKKNKKRFFIKNIINIRILTI
jgi:hypothetical protein